MSAIRKPPMLGPAHKGYGHCKWCNGEIRYPEGHKRAGQINTRRGWHRGEHGEPDCLYAYNLATRSDVQREACWERDHGVCAKCGADNSETVIGWRRGSEVWCDEDWLSPKKRPPGWFAPRYTKVFPIYNWEADHIMPLHLVDRDKPRDEILPYWGIENLQTLCVIPCHRDKSAEEARQRGKTRRIKRQRQGKPKRKQRLKKKINGKVEINPTGGEVPW